MRRGFTMIELLVAVVLIDVGLLGLVAASAVVVRANGDLRARSAATRAAANRVQALVASPCASASGSAAPAAGMRERWDVTLSPHHWREIRDSVAYDVSGATRSFVLRTRATC